MAMSSRRRFGQRPPPVSRLIKTILDRYPDGQIFKELIQNADDAGAKVVHFYIDTRQHPTTSLVTNSLAAYQGPALIVANDAMFKAKDWEGIERLQDSIKAEDPFNVGKYGIGFNSVYHITDVPSIISDDTVAYLDPQEKVWPREPGSRYSLREMLYSNSLIPFNGIEGFNYRITKEYKKTLFRFPLRSQPSDLSNSTYNVDSIIRLTGALKDEAKFLLLFLKSVYKISVSKIAQNGTHQLQFQVQISEDSCGRVVQEHTSFMSKLTTRHSICPYTIRPCISNVLKFSVEIKDSASTWLRQGTSSSKTTWLVANQVGCHDGKVLEAARKQHAFPWVGVALELSEQNISGACANGRIFCFLPMPAEATSKLPVHINGTFGLNDDRRTIKWPVGERRNDAAAQWNKMLIKECLPSCYNHLLCMAVTQNYITSSDFLYKVLPCINLVRNSQWKSVLEPLYTSVFGWACLQAMGSNEWIKIKLATIISEGDHLHAIVKSVLSNCDLKIVELPDHIHQALREYYPHLLNIVSSAVARRALKAHPHTYTSKSSGDKLELLRYCLDDGFHAHSQLDGLELIQLADGSFKRFNEKENRQCQYLYVCSSKFPRRLFPHCDHCLIDIKDADLQEKLSSVANSSHTQLANLNLANIELVVYLFQSLYPSSWKDKKVVKVCQEIPYQWFEVFWKWVQAHNLSHFKDLFIIPIVTGNVSLDLRVARLTNQAESSIVVIPEFSWCSAEMLSILGKYGVQYTMQRHVRYLRHNQLYDFVNTYDQNGVLKAIFNACSHPGSVKLDEKEATVFRTFLSQPWLISSQAINVLLKLKIFKVLNCEEYVISLQDARSSSWNGQLTVEPPDFDFSQESLPSNLVVLSRESNPSSLLSIISKYSSISFPKSQISFIVDELIPFIESGQCPSSEISPLMEHVLHLIPILKRRHNATEYHNLTCKLSSLPFLNVTSGPRKAPKELYDYSKPELRALFRGKPLFPCSPFNCDEFLSQLRDCKLQTSVGGSVLLDLIHDNAVSCSNLREPQEVSKQCFSRAKAALDYIRKKPNILDDIVSFPRGRTQTLESALESISNALYWLPICATPPEGYSKHLPWKGSSCTSHLTALTRSVSLCSREDFSTLPHLVGSQMYIVECPSKLCKTLQTSSILIKAVIDHFKIVIKSKRDFDGLDLDKQTHAVYRFLHENLRALKSTYSTSQLCSQEFVWFKKQHKFIAPKMVILREHPTLSDIDCLYPYYIQLPDDFIPYTELLAHFGVEEKLTDSEIISVLQRIENDKQKTERAWKTVEIILNWLTRNGTEDASYKLTESDTLLVPVDSSRELCLMDVKSVVYSNLDLKSLQNKGESIHFIHRRLVHLAPYLGVRSLSDHLGISRDAFGDVGQHEPLVTRLKNILRDYQGDLTIIKELLQNADDAGATEITICHDIRNHSVSPDSLIFPGMVKCHGPALVVHNNATFSDEDFENITKLAGETKSNKPLKIGKFGIGFCSVYHITDIPSFISREWLYIFDPTVNYLRKEIVDRSKPGKKVPFTSPIVHQFKQLVPYKKMFGFDQKKPYQGTLFRFPLRTSASELSSLIYDRRKVEHLMKGIQYIGTKLLLFLNSLKCITISRWDSERNKPTILWYSEKSIIYHVPPTNHEGKDNQVLCQFKECDGTGDEVYKHWLVSNSKLNSPDTSKLSIASAACLLHLHHKKYSPKAVEGEMFCYLPLSLKTGLPVHITANFAVLSDRSGIHSSDSEGSTNDNVQWNVNLMQTVVPRAYYSLLVALKQLCAKSKISISDYKYYSLWPLAAHLKIRNPWDNLISCLYQSLSDSKLFYSASCRTKWVQLADARILSLEKILSTRSSQSECVVKAAEKLGYVLIDLPSQYQESLPLAMIKACLVNEEEFLNSFFANIRNISKDDRNEILFLAFKELTLSGKDYIEQHLKTNQCIPIAPHGESIRKCSEIVDPKAEFSCLYDQDDHVFPLDDFYYNKHVCSSMKDLGMISSHLPIPMIEERAKTILELFSANRSKALEKSRMILHCITQLVKQSEQQTKLTRLAHVEFLPVMKKPDSDSYPGCFQWFGRRKSLLCGEKLVKGSKSAPYLAGSQVCILNESGIKYGGCGHISKDTALAVGISLFPSYDSVIKHLKHIESTYAQERNKQSLKKWVDAACEKIYDHLDSQISQRQISNDQLKELKVMKSLWTKHSFVSPDMVAKSWDRNGPYLYCIPELLTKNSNLSGILQFKNEFSLEDYLSALEQAYLENSEKSITNKKETMNIVLDILRALVSLLDSTKSSLTEPQVCYIPDTTGILRRTSELAYNDAPWCQIEDGTFFVHDTVSRGIATKLGVTLVRSKALEQYESSEQHWGGVPFGQRENLTQRIRNILGDYPHGITVLKELLQNADDVKATKMYVILDKRMHGTRKLPSSEWQDLQGPALLVWNDSVFSEEDLKGIQELGLGSKRSSSEAIGQFGIGFNVVYHLTDCPSFFTNGNTFCILDPHCRYVPGANPLKPGRRYDRVDARFWENCSDLKSAYLRQESMEGCPGEVRNSGTLFRFPLRHTEELVQKSELVCEESSFGSSNRPLTVRKMKDDLESWFSDLKEALIFLNNVTELKLFEIGYDSNMILTHHYCTRFITDHEKDPNFQQKLDHFADTREPFVDNYSIFLHECLPRKKIEKWIIQLGIGDMQNPQQHWIYLPKRKPRHGLAFPISEVDFDGRIFCFLPLPSMSHLPVHVNGDFSLDSARRGLWTIRDNSDTDERYKWNRHLLEAIASSYVQLIVSYQEELLSCQSSKEMIDKYYKIFPRWLEEHQLDNNMQFLATLVYQKLSLLNSPVLIVRNDDTDVPFSAEWLPPTDAEKPSHQIHFWDCESLRRSLPPILKRIGINLTAAPIFVRYHFEDCGIQLPLADPMNVYNYYRLYYSQVCEKFPCPITETQFQSVKAFLKFVKYVTKREYLTKEDENGIYSKLNFCDSPYGIPLLLTSDENLRYFSDDKAICSEYSMIFVAECGDKFLHPEMCKLKLAPDYFVRPAKENWSMISGILQSILPESLKRVQKITNASNIIDIQNLLSPLWKCLISDQVFSIHLDEIITEWALLLTTSDELFAYKSDQQLLPVIPLSYREDSKVLQILEEHGMPILNTRVVDSIYCKKFCPQMSELQKILKNLVYLYKQSGLPSLMNDECTDQIATLFTYFGRIHFAHEADSLTAVKSLPLFKDIRDGKYCTLSGEAYIWPDDVIMLDIGREHWMEQTSVVYLSRRGTWNNLGNNITLNLKEVSPLFIYVQFIFPHFHLLSNEERMTHLKHIRDTESLFNTAWENRKRKDHIGGEAQNSTDFIDALKKLPCLLKNGVFQPISKFCDPEVPILGLFLGDEYFPPDDLTKDSKWLHFFRKLGLRREATKEEFIDFCTRIAAGNQLHIRESSQALMEYLFATTSWHEEAQFLNNISKIPFVCTERVKDLGWIIPVPSTESTIQQHGEMFHLTSLKKAASLDVKELIWTIKPVIELPYGMLSRSKDEQKAKEFLRCIKVIRQPSIEDVVKNMKQISESRFANFKLFDHSAEDCIPSIERKQLLFKVLVQCFEYLKGSGCSTADLNCLQYAPCIPVTTASDSAVPVTALITPLQVVASTDTIIKHLVPFLNPLPDGLYSVLPDVLSNLGVTTEIQYKNLRNALETMHQYIEQPLDPNSAEIVIVIIKKFHTIEIPPTITKPVYLPNELKMLVESTKLLYDDHGRYKNARFDTRGISYSFISLLTDRNEERSRYGFTLRDFVSTLPAAVRPLPLSVHCYEKLTSGCSIQERSLHSDFITELETAFRFPNFSKVIEKVLLASSVDGEICNKFTQNLAAFCSSVQVLSVTNLKVDVYLTLCRPPALIGTAKVDFAFVQDADSDSFIVCADSGTKMKPKVLESFSKRLISTIASMSNTSVADLGETIEGSITDLLQDQSEEAVSELLGELGVSGVNLGLCGSDYRPVSVKLGNQIPDYLHHRLYADIYNIFRPQELIAYETTDNIYVFARVEYRIAEPTKDGELEKYIISTSEDDEEGKEVTIIEMYKILRMKDMVKESGNREMVLYDPESDSVHLWEAIKDESLKEILKKVASELKKIWKIRDEDLRRKAIKALYLKWHPDKNPHRFATQAFQYIQQQIERLERGLDVTVDFSEGETGFTSPFWTRTAQRWEEEVHTQGENRRREQDRRHPRTQDDLDDLLNQRSVSPDPRTAQVWLKQAEHDLTALQALVREANVKKEVCAHVCFMAHQVAEKGLKAGMYKVVGLDPNILRWHQLNGHASAIEQVIDHRITSGLGALARTLESYYLNPRYPNRYTPAKVPSDQYTIEEAIQAEGTAKTIMNIIQKLF